MLSLYIQGDWLAEVRIKISLQSNQVRIKTGSGIQFENNNAETEGSVLDKCESMQMI